MKLAKLSNKSLDKLLELERTKKSYGIEGIRKFLGKIGNPQDNLKIIHVAGTNGKGSVCAMICSSLKEAGYKVGMFSSPHLVKLQERFRINGRKIRDKELDKLVAKVVGLEKKHKIDLSFFETLTVVAFLYFNEKNADYAVMETGMGGRIDATNVVTPILSVITNVGHDHMEFLGHTIKKIAKDKAGIIKQAPVVTHTKGEALDVIKKECKRNKVKLIRAKKVSYRTGLQGEFQKENAATAAAALKELGIPGKYITLGLEKAVWKGRFELHGNILLDAAHNPEGVAALITSLKNLTYRNLTVILSIMNGKEIELMAEKLNKLNADVIVTKAKITRAMQPEEVAGYLRNAIIIHKLKDAIAFAKKTSGKKDLIVITGSIFLVGEAYSFLSHHFPM